MARRTVLVSANWKMHHNHLEALRYVQQLAALLRVEGVPAGREVCLHPPFTSLRSVQVALESDGVPVSLGAQDCHEEDRGAFTGAVSAEMLARLAVRYVIVGHSERRILFGEGDDLVRRKLDAVLRHAMTPILCVGERLAEREAGEAEERVEAQLRAALDGRDPAVLARVVVAYEPVWAIGTGRTATAADAQTMAKQVRAVVEGLGGATARDGVRVLYGGSVTPENAAELLAGRDVDGLLVGGASLDPTRFHAIVRAGS